MAAPASSSPKSRIEAQPLYVKARKIMIDRLIAGQWRPGQLLPSEFAIADELGVSQGTVRKALDDMTAQGLLVRKQGRGTFVAEAEDKSVLFRFYRLTQNDDTEASGTAEFPDSDYLSQSCEMATETEQDIFGLGADDKVWRFERMRSDPLGPILWEQLVLPARQFPDFTPQTRLPNNVYQFYGSHYGIIVARVNEKLRAVSAPSNVSEMLGLPDQEPVLEIDRRAVSLSDQVVEWRISLCRSDRLHYRNELK